MPYMPGSPVCLMGKPGRARHRIFGSICEPALAPAYTAVYRGLTGSGESGDLELPPRRYGQAHTRSTAMKRTTVLLFAALALTACDSEGEDAAEARAASLELLGQGLGGALQIEGAISGGADGLDEQAHVCLTSVLRRGSRFSSVGPSIPRTTSQSENKDREDHEVCVTCQRASHQRYRSLRWLSRHARALKSLSTSLGRAARSWIDLFDSGLCPVTARRYARASDVRCARWRSGCAARRVQVVF